MRNQFTLKYVIRLLVVLFAFSFNLEAGYAEELGSSKRPGANIAEKVILPSRDHPRIHAAIEARKRHAENLMEIFGVVGTGIGISADQEPVVRVFTTRAGITEIPKRLDDVLVETKVTGRFYALQDPPEPPPAPYEEWPRPVPIGVSTGHPDISAGTIAARVTDGGSVFALSNNHVYANINSASIGDNVLQPGPWDGGIDPDHAIGTLHDFDSIQFRYRCGFWGLSWCYPENRIDAAIALSSTENLGYATPPDGYGVPNSSIHPAYGDPNFIGDEDVGQLVGKSVRKYGRTTALTSGTIDSFDVTVNVCYDDACSLVARFVDQLIIKPGSFSAGGDSGSLIVTNDEYNYPVGLLFAGSSTDTLANRIDLVLDRFNVAIDSGTVEPFTDIAISSVSAQPSVVKGDTVPVRVTVENVGNQHVDSCDVTLTDATYNVNLGTQTASDLAPGVAQTLTFSWDTDNASLGLHTLEAAHHLTDDHDTNNTGYTSSEVVMALRDIAIQWVKAPSPVTQGDVVKVDVRVINLGNQDVSGDITVSLVSDNATPENSDDIVPESQTIEGGLSDGEFADRTFLWDTTDANIDSHLLTASHNLSDDEESNNVGTTTVKVEELSVIDTMHIGDLDGESGYLFWGFWWADVYITVHDRQHNPVSGAIVYGTFDDGPSVFQCTTNESGWCYVEGYQRRRRCLTFTVGDVSHPSLTYISGDNHDVDGDTDGVSITVCKP